MKSINLFVNAVYFSTLALFEPLDKLPKINVLIRNFEAANNF